ncbi:MAG: hypothetical protein M0R28_20415 [Pigmentiphaga sp.]|nr:hypothetical protein [Pigmentiphaga sp.]
MTDAPERIWAKAYHGEPKCGYWEDRPIRPNNPENVGTEYIRADSIEAMQALIGAAESLVEFHNLPPLAKRLDVFQMRMAALACALSSTGKGE